MYDISSERSSYSASTHVILHKIHAEMTEILQVKDCILFHILSSNIHTIEPINHTEWWIIKVKHIPHHTYQNISIKKINNIILFSSL